MPNAKNKGLNLEKFKALAGFASSPPGSPTSPLPVGPPPPIALPELEPLATIEMSWAEVAVRLAVAALQIHFSNNPKHHETMDEFLVRGELRAILVSMLSSGFVTFKESAYEDVKNSQRLDVLLRSSRKDGKQIAWIELKSDSASPGDLETDWAKLHNANTSERRISIFSGILTQKRFDEFEALYKTVEDLRHEHKFVATVNRQFINFESLRKAQSGRSDESFERLYSVAYVYAIDTPSPNIAFNVIEKPEKSVRRTD